jgi:hypothetical protein
MLGALRFDGCPVCRDLRAHDRSYFFWFFNENYFESHTLDGLTRSWGFCRGHAATLTRQAGGAYALAAVHRFLVVRLRAVLARMLGQSPRAEGTEVTLLTADLCPPCRSRRESAARGIFWVARLLRDPQHADRYAQPGLLCLPHLQGLIPWISRPVLDRLLSLHADALRSAIKSLDGVQVERDGNAEPAPDTEDAVGRMVRLVAGDQGAVGFPSLGDAQPSSGTRDPIAELLEVVRWGGRCPVCSAARQAWIEWVRWLDGAIADGQVVDDLLPTCPEHVSAFVQVGRQALGVATASRALSVALSRLEEASKTLRSPMPHYPARPVAQLVEAVAGPRRRERQARAGLVREAHCPACRRLDVAEERTLALLFALAGDRAHRPDIERGYGLCAPHFRRALALEPPEDVRQGLIEIEAAKLARLEWELDEAMRKVGWEYRPEATGTETGAWRRALMKLSGSLADED